MKYTLNTANVTEYQFGDKIIIFRYGLEGKWVVTYDGSKGNGQVLTNDGYWISKYVFNGNEDCLFDSAETAVDTLNAAT